MAGDRAGVARCHEMAGRWLEAARELDMAPGPDEISRCVAIQRLLFFHLEEARRQGREKREAQALLSAAGRLAEDGNLVAAIARYRVCGVADEVADISRRLGWHDSAIAWMLSSGNAAHAMDYARQGGFPVSTEFFRKLVDEHLDFALASGKSLTETRSTLLSLLSSLAESLSPEDARRAVEDFFRRAYGSFAPVEGIPEEGLALLLRARASAAIITLLSYEMLFEREPDLRVKDFVDRRARAAVVTGDPGLVACHAYYEDMSRFRRPGDDFERAVAQLPLSRETAALLGLSPLRHREAVDMLMEAGEIEEAEKYCRIQGNHGLGARWTEQRGEFKEAVRWHRDAGDLDGALRCAQASADERMIARVREWRGEPGEALRIWKKLKRKSDVARLLKKHPTLRT